jgi:hypothetical protein
MATACVRYEIRVEGGLGEGWDTWFGGLGDQQHGQRLAEIDEFPDAGMVDDRLRLAQVSLDHHRVVTGLQRTGVSKHHRVVIDIHHAHTRVNPLGDLMHIALGRQPGPDLLALACVYRDTREPPARHAR